MVVLVLKNDVQGVNDTRARERDREFEKTTAWTQLTCNLIRSSLVMGVEESDAMKSRFPLVRAYQTDVDELQRGMSIKVAQRRRQ